jgi:hypothetical protein
MMYRPSVARTGGKFLRTTGSPLLLQVTFTGPEGKKSRIRQPTITSLSISAFARLSGKMVGEVRGTGTQDVS